MTMPRWRASSTPSRSSSFISAAGLRATRRGAISSLTWRDTTIGNGCTRLWAISRPSRPSGKWQANRVHENGGRSPDVLPPTGPLVTRPGDLWLMGDHRLICGDSRERSTYDALMGSDVADLVFSDPPYNVPIKGHVCGLGSVQHEEFAFASGEMSETEFVDFLSAFL